MKRNLLLLIVLCCTMSMLAQNGKISYQAVVRDSENHLVYDTPLQVTVSLANSETGTAVYSEQHAVTSNANGLISLLIGDGENKQGHWENVQWNTAWVTATIRKASDQTFLAEHHLPLSAVPYALYADFADSMNLAVLQDYLDEHHYVTEDFIPTVAQSDWNEDDEDSQAYIKNKPDLSVYATNAHLNDTLAHYATTDALKDSLTRYIDKDKLNDTLSSYYTKDNVDTKLNEYEKKSELCGDVKECIKDTLAAYYDTTHTQSVISDTATALRAMMGDAAYNSKITLKKNNVELDSFRLNQQTDKAINIPVPTTVAELSDASNYVTKTKLNDTLGAYYDTANVKQMLKPYLKANELCDSIVKCDVIKDMRDSLDNAFDTLKYYTTSNEIDTLLGAYYDSTKVKSVISDTATALRAMMGDAANDGIITIDVSGGTIENPTFSVNQANNQTVKITIPETIPAEDGQLTIIAAGDTTRFTANQATNDTVRLNKFATKDTLAYYAMTSALKDSLTHYVGKDMLNDTLSKYTTSKKIDTLLGAYAKTEDLAYYERQDNLCRDVKICIKDTLSKYTTTNQLDTVIRKYGYVTIAHLNDTLTEVYNTIRNDSIALHKAIKDTANAIRGDICDSATACITKALADPSSEINQAIDTIAQNNIHDTAVAIRNSIGNGTLTIQKNGETVGTFKANQATDQPINITVPTAVSQLTDANDYAKVNGNTFTGTHIFNNATITVHSNEDAIKRPVPTTTPAPTCENMNAVNVCDLLAVFDSLSRRIDTMQKNLDNLMNSVPPLFNGLTVNNATSSTMKVTANFSSPITAITSYEFCYRRHDGVGETQCVTSTTNEVVLTGLQPYTTYDFTASATNLAGTTPSDGAVSRRTLAEKPSGNLITEAVNPRAFKVTVEHLDLGGAPSGTVKIYYKKKGTATQCSESISDYDNTPISFPVSLTADDDSTFVHTIDNLDASEPYCIMVELINIDSTKVLGPQEETSGGLVELEITSNAKNGTLDVCEQPSVEAVYTAHPSLDAPGDYTYQWEVVGTSLSENTGSENHVMFSHAVGNYTISCTATHPTYGTVSTTYSITVTNTGHVPTFALCSDGLQVTLSNIAHADTIKWGDNSQEVLSSNSASHPYETSNNYTITVKNTSGCVATKELPIGLSTMHPCTVSSKQSNERGSSETSIDSLKDYDGNWYAVAQIGNLCWMKSNLRTTHFSDGTEIANGTGTNANNSMSDNTAYYYQPNASSHFDGSYDFTKYNVSTYGLYYNWVATMHGAESSNEMPSGVQGVCPEGWHVPSVREWDSLIAFVQTLPEASYNQYLHVMAGGCDWATGASGKPGCYQSPVRNSSEFSGIPAGEATGIFRYNKFGNNMPQEAFFWTSTASTPLNGSPQAYDYEMYSSQGRLLKYSTYNSFGYSVRCVRDYVYVAPTIKPTVTTKDATNVGIDTATLNGSITIPAGVTIMARGFKFKAASAAEYNTEYLTGDELVYTVKGLTAGTEYTYLAFAIYDDGTEFGVEKSFTTQREPNVSTAPASNIGVHAAKLNGNITNPDNASITAQGFEVKIKNGTYKRIAGTGSGNTFTADTADLLPDTTYIFKAFITYNNHTVYGDSVTFKTQKAPTVYTDAASNIGMDTAKLNGHITNLDEISITAQGFEMKIKNGTYTQIAGTASGTGGTFTANTTDLKPDTTYIFKAYITYDNHTVYGDSVTFKTKKAPTVYTDAASNIGMDTAKLNGHITNPDEISITAQGFEMKIKNGTYTQIAGTTSGTGGTFTANTTDLLPDTTYIFKAYITYNNHTVYGDSVTFKTKKAPTVYTDAASNIGMDTAKLNGHITNPDEISITAQGFEMKIKNGTYTQIAGTASGTGGTFTANTTDLEPDTTYIFKAYITYNNHTVYGDSVTFKTKKEPTVSTGTASNIVTNAATLSGTITNPDNISITAKGFEVKIKNGTYKQIASTSTENTFTADTATLLPDTTYIFKAYITYNNHTVYGDSMTFKTKKEPTVVTGEASQIGSSIATLNGSYTNEGNVLITKGFEFKADSESKFDTVFVTGDELTYDYDTTGLTPSTKYKYRAFVSFDGKTKYGVDTTFTTAPPTQPTVTTSTATNVTSTTATLSGTVTDPDHLVVTKGFHLRADNGEYVPGDEIIIDGNDNAITHDLTTLSPSTTYHYRAFVTTASGTTTGNEVTFTTASASTTFTCGTDKVTDANGHVYNTVLIGQGNSAQCWMAQNLRSTSEPGLTEGGSSYSSTIPYYYDNTNSSLALEDRGYLYNWVAVMNGAPGSNSNPSGVQGICPDGWHVPSHAEWEQLKTNVKVAANMCGSGIAKALATTSGWITNSNECVPGNNPASNNSTGFNAFPAGEHQGVFLSEGNVAAFWTSRIETKGPYYFEIDNDYADLQVLEAEFPGNKSFGLSVRCVRNAGGGTSQANPTVTTFDAYNITSSSVTFKGEITNLDNIEITKRGFQYKETGGTYITVAVDGSDNPFTTTLNSGLVDGHTYTYHAYITYGSNDTAKGQDLEFTLPSATPTFTCGTSTVKDNDYDNNHYATVEINGQCWMAENLRSTKYSDGSPISTGIYAINGNPNTYGYFYTWSTVMNGATATSNNPSNVNGICPTGWHVPSQIEFNSLVDANYDIPSAFNSQKGGYIEIYEEEPYPAGTTLNDYYWSTSSTNGNHVYMYTQLIENELYLMPGSSVYFNDYLMSVRCVRDAESGGGTTQTDPTVTTEEPTIISSTSANLNATISNPSNETIAMRGFYLKVSGGNYEPVLVYETDNNYSATIDTLSEGVIYTYRAFFTYGNNFTSVLGDEVTFTTTPASTSFTCGTSTVKDADNNTYQTVSIGSKCWMAENLKSTHYSNGDAISGSTFTVPLHYSNQSESEVVSQYGYLYTWNAVIPNGSSNNTNLSIVQGICPSGWHVPSKDELFTISDAQAPTFINDIYAGYINGVNDVNINQDETAIWSSTEHENNNKAYYYSYMYGMGSAISSTGAIKTNYFSVRCVRDAESGGDGPVEPDGPTYSQIIFTPGIYGPYTCGVTITGLNFNNSSNQGSVKVYCSTLSAPEEWAMAYTVNVSEIQDPLNLPIGFENCGSFYFKVVIKNTEDKEKVYISDDAINVPCD